MLACDPMQGLQIVGGNESTGVTSFVQEACEHVDVLGKHYVPSSYATAASQLQDLKEYFRRPRVIVSRNVPFGLRFSAPLHVTSDKLFTVFFPDGRERLKGVFGVRFKMVFTLQVACTPFHQGLLALAWQYGLASDTPGCFDRHAKSSTVTNLPHSRLDLSSSTMTQLTVPFLYEHEFLPVHEPDLVYGTGGVTVVSAVPAFTGGVEPNFKILLHLEDMELIGASPSETRTVVLQSGLGAVESEYESDAFPMSSALGAASRAIGFIAKGVPSLSTLASPASWALKRVADSARSFGYSKPIVRDPVARMHFVPHVGEFNVDQPSTSMVVGPIASNHLAVHPQFAATDVDEMSLPFLTSQWSQVCVFNVTASDEQGADVYGAAVSPSSFWFRRPANKPAGNFPPPKFNASDAANAFQPSSLFFWSSMFKLWRGDIEFRFTVVKTKMHGGRLMVHFAPGAIQATDEIESAEVTPILEAPQPFGQSAIFDLRDGNVFTFRVPYSSPTPYLRFSEQTGSLSMLISDPLQTTGVIADSVQVIVEVRGCSNFELAHFCGPAYAAIPDGTAVFQSGLPSLVGGDPSQTSIGEKIMSVKQLIMIPKVSVFTQAGSSRKDYAIPPWWWHPNISSAKPGPAAGSGIAESFGVGGNAACCFVFARGSTDANCYSDLNSLTSVHAYVSPFEANDPIVTDTAQDFGATMNAPRVYNRDFCHVRFPAFQGVQRFLTWVYNTTVWNPRGATDAVTDPVFNRRAVGPNPVVGKLQVQNRQTGIATLFLSRSAGDDAMLGHYIGPPPLLLYSTNPDSTTYDSDSVTYQ